ncbi:leucine Rich repeat-containing domain protein, partial [Necator americanus]
MSMSRSILQELCDYVQQKPSTVLGNKFFDYRVALQADVSYKGDKFEPRIFVISKFRLFILSGKSPSSLKIDRSYHLLSIKSVNILNNDEVAIAFDEAGHRKKYVIKSPQASSSALVKHVLAAFLRYFPDIGAQLRSLIEFTPESCYDEFSSMSGDAAARACHSFRRTYAALCDFYDQPYRDEVSWDVEKIYAVNRLRSLRIEDFSHLLPKDLLPITGVLQYSSYFTGLVADGIRMTTEVIDVIMSVIRKSRYLQHLQLRNCALPRYRLLLYLLFSGHHLKIFHLLNFSDFITLFASALQQNPSIPLESVDFSKNVLDDKKGFVLLSNVLPRLTTLRQLVKEFFSMAVNLSHISFANTILPVDLMKAMLLGLASNQQLKPFHLDISGTCEKTSSSVLEACLTGVQCSSLSLRDNNLETEMQGVVHTLGNIKTLRRLDLGGANLLALRRSSKQTHAAVINKTILDIVKLFSDESSLEELILSDARLGPHLSVLLNTLGAATSLRFLDISNNDLGHFGARILSKALELNASLRTIVIDNNHLGVEGLYDLATAVNMNRTITSIPYPVQDVCECLSKTGCDRSRVLVAMTQIESCLERNRQSTNADMANFRIAAANLDLGNPEKWNAVGDVLSSAAEEPFPSRLEDMVDDFVDQARRECVLNLQSTLSRLRSESGDAPKIPGKAELIAMQRLRELWMDDLKRVF